MTFSIVRSGGDTRARERPVWAFAPYFIEITASYYEYKNDGTATRMVKIRALMLL